MTNKKQDLVELDQLDEISRPYDLIPMINGFKIYGFKNDLVADDIRENGIYEREFYEFLVSFLRTIDKPICIDVGANIGNHTLTMAKYSHLVIAYEPIPFIFKLLKQTLNANAIKNVVANNLGLSNVKEQPLININFEDNLGASSISCKNPSSKKIKIICEAGDKNLSQYAVNHVDLIKIDVEGYETNVVLGLKETIKKNRPVVILEWNNQETRDGFTEHDIFNSVFYDYCILPLFDNHERFRAKCRKTPIVKWFRKALKFFHKRLVQFKPISSKFYYSEDYQLIMLIPNEKRGLVNQVMNW